MKPIQSQPQNPENSETPQPQRLSWTVEAERQATILRGAVEEAEALTWIESAMNAAEP